MNPEIKTHPAAAAVATEAYKALLAGPVPTDPCEYRRAIMEAVLIGQILATATPETRWQSSPPDEAGAWEIACRETDFEPQPVTVTERPEGLWAEDPHVGAYPIQSYHDGLTDLFWRKAECASQPTRRPPRQPVKRSTQP